MNLESCWQCGASPEAATVSQKSRPSFHNLFTSNDVPLESETSSIRDIISDGQDQIDALNVQIAKMEAAITRLTQRRDAIEEHVNQHRVILSPVRRVPPELICEILALSVSGDDDEESMDKPQLHIRQICGLNKPPWHLGLICRSWRRTVLGYPTLWCSIILPSSSPFPSDHHSLLLMIETQLVRSAEAPLRVCWASNQHEDSPDLDAVTLLLAHSSRWRVLGVFYRGVKLDWLNAARGSLPALETLAVIGGEAEIPDIFLTAPSLRRVFLTDWHHRPSWSVAKIPWAQITHYAESFTADSQVERLHSLQTAPNLVSCAISLSYWTDSYQPGVLTVLPRLQRLRVVEAEFLQHLKAPLLQELFFWNNMRQDGPGCSEIVPFVERSACSLQKLCLMGGSVDSNLITVLGGLQSVTHLIIHDNAWDNELEQIDLFDGLAKYLCPNLTYLAFGFGAKFATGHFLAIAESRFRLEPPQLRLFRTYNDESEDCPSDTAVAIQSMCDQGFDVAFIGSHRAGIFQGKDFFYSL